jgi:hypothetical protein
MVTLAGATAVLHGYSLKPQTWATKTVLYYINPANADGLGALEVEASIRAGADAWHVQSDANFQFQYGGRTSGTTVAANGKNEVFFRPEVHSTTPSTLATTYWWSDGTGHLVDTDIKIWDAAARFFAGSAGCSAGYYLQDVVTHEFGHALGLNHSDISEATMWPTIGSCSQRWRSLHADDIAAVQAQYPPVGPRPPGPVTVTGP